MNILVENEISRVNLVSSTQRTEFEECVHNDIFEWASRKYGEDNALNMDYSKLASLYWEEHFNSR